MADVSESDIESSRNQISFSERVMWDLKIYTIVIII